MYSTRCAPVNAQEPTTSSCRYTIWCGLMVASPASLTATVAFRHPTIESLATVIVEGEPEVEDSGVDEDWSREDSASRDIAIVGIATRFPGDMNTPDETWQALIEGRDAITDLPEGRWEEFLDEPRIAERVGKARTRGGYLSDIKGFDAEFFALSKMEADNIDPQQRMALELTWEALEHARIPASSLRGESVAVYIGSSLNDYSFLAMSDPSIAHPYAITGTASSIIANRVSYFYDFRGPSVAIDTACSSSLVAAHQGVQALRLSLVGLGLTALIQLGVALASGSVGLLNDTFGSGLPGDPGLGVRPLNIGDMAVFPYVFPNPFTKGIQPCFMQSGDWHGMWVERRIDL